METDTLWSQIRKNGSLMKSMTMVDFFIENKGKLQLKQQDIINHTKVGKGVNFLCKWELSSHINTLPMETDTLWSQICENGSIMKSLAMVDFFIENKGTFFPHPDITYGNRHSLVCICENRSIMKSMAMVYFFIENKGTFFPYHYITYGNRHALVRICKNGSLMKSMAMVDFFIENKDTLWSQISENGSIMKSMAMVDFFIVNKGKLQLKQQDIINHTRVGKGVNFLYKKELSSHILTLPMETDTLWSVSAKNRSIMKSKAMVDFFFIENKGTFFPYHYITYGNRHALVQIC
ncbi:hypothetical protein H6P81_021513 [Aristolochia fimbriata]|uniref:Uncharacterized protein n=1 Tax=Aristolochia fimbriata TaxID=158543 RepID=A0AAV7DRB3_ARIFI|nr:hypothetical protein H6P81_021513 [Aristolochia fimbriata]